MIKKAEKVSRSPVECAIVSRENESNIVITVEDNGVEFDQTGLPK